MPESNSKNKRKKRVRLVSLRTRTLQITLLGALVLSTVTFVVGIMLYTQVLLEQYETKAFMLAQGAENRISESVDVEQFTKQVMDIYDGLSDEERAENMSKEYRDKFKSVTVGNGYDHFISLLKFYKDYSRDIADVYFGVYDRRTMALVYVADPATEKGMVRKPGDYDEIDSDEMDTFLGWDGKETLYDISDTPEYGWLCTAGMPVKDKAGREIGFFLVDISLSKVLRGIGSFALKYYLAVLPKGEPDDVADLAEAIDVYYKSPACQITDRAEVSQKLERIGTLREVMSDGSVMSGVTQGHLSAGDSAALCTLALKMQETAGNDYQDRAVNSSFDIKLYATQWTEESDSFDFVR